MRLNLKCQTGFSLIELMITVAIVGLLAAVALPSYNSSVMKGKRAEGRTALLELMQQQERYLTQNNCYLGFTNTSGTVAVVTPPSTCPTPNTVPFKTYSGDTATNPNYYLSAAACTGSSVSECVMLTATLRNGLTDVAYGNVQLLSTGAKTCTGTKASTNECWK